MIIRNPAIFLLAALVVAGCQTTTRPTMSLDNAREITADFNIAKFRNLPRNSDALRLEFGEGGPIPGNCDAIRQERNNRLSELVTSMRKAFITRQAFRNSQNSLRAYGAVSSFMVVAEESMVSGRFTKALEYISEALSITSDAALRSRLYSLQARIYSQIGDTDAAETAMGRFGADPQWMNSPKGQIFLNAGMAAITQSKGNLQMAEHHYRQAIYNASFTTGQHYISSADLRSGLVMSLLQQDRLTEAEAEARIAIQKTGIGLAARYVGKKVYQTQSYRGINAGPLAILAEVFLRQGRLDDAEYMARIALNMHEVGCSEPQSLGLNRTRAMLISILAQREKWPAVLEQMQIARTTLSGMPVLFEQHFGSSLEYAEAEIFGGDSRNGMYILENQLSGASEDAETNLYTEALVKGLLASGHARLGNRDKSLASYAEATATLLNNTTEQDANISEVSTRGLKDRILSAYMDFLQGYVDEGRFRVSGIDIPKELFQIASAKRLSRVQQAFSASRTRAAVGNPELSKLVRQQQDLTQETTSVAETLAYLSFSPEKAAGTGQIEKLTARMQELKLAIRTLEDEILTRFPEYTDFINPRPMTLPEIAGVLHPHQALLAYHVMDDRTYLWSMDKRGKLGFSVSSLGHDALSEKIATLRKAVNPQRLLTIRDIPEYDVVLAYQLYTELLAPVEGQWQNIDEILVVTDNILGSLPFSMLTKSSSLVASENGTLFSRYTDVDWLTRSYAVTQLPSIQALKELARNQSETQLAERRPFVGFGDPHFNNRDIPSNETRSASAQLSLLRSAVNTRAVESADIALLPHLPDTRDELHSIASALGANPSTDLYTGKQATEQRVKTMDLSPYRVISFATHGLVPGDLNGLYQPALALSNPQVVGGDEDGLLTVNEILGLKLDADFAVLSACNTAAADGQGAQAISGLGRAFFYAGTRSLLVSHWPVHSKATTTLMSTLFSDLTDNPGIGRSKAMQRTRIKMIEEMGYHHDGQLAFSYAHPIFWAPFTIVGDGGH
ncbi:MAG: CHAT domain-containing protein [Sedimenticola sp.]